MGEAPQSTEKEGQSLWNQVIQNFDLIFFVNQIWVNFVYVKFKTDTFNLFFLPKKAHLEEVLKMIGTFESLLPHVTF